MRRWVIVLLVAPVLILLIDSLLSGTELITSLDNRSLWIMRGLGIADGVLLWILIRTDPTYSPQGIGRELLMMLMMPVFGAVTFDALSWRVSNWGAFGFSSAPFELQSYPIKHLNDGRKGRRDTISIDPFDTGESSHIPIPRDQYKELIASSGQQCVTVSQRRSISGAVQIQTDGTFTFNQPAAVIVQPC